MFNHKTGIEVKTRQPAGAGEGSDRPRTVGLLRGAWRLFHFRKYENQPRPRASNPHGPASVPPSSPCSPAACEEGAPITRVEAQSLLHSSRGSHPEEGGGPGPGENLIKHNLSGLKQHELILFQFQRSEVENEAVGRLHSFRGSGGPIPLPSPTSTGHLHSGPCLFCNRSLQRPFTRLGERFWTGR